MVYYMGTTGGGLWKTMDGGETWFPYRGVRFQPAVGRALFFEHQQLHEGVMVYAGVKYALRTDVMYRRG